jgi:hypothetical protein
MAGTEQPDGLAEEVVKDLELQPDQAKEIKGGIKDPKPILRMDADAAAAGPPPS